MNGIELKNECALLLKAICYVYGVEQNLTQAMMEILKLNTQGDETYWEKDSKFSHYCLREANVIVNEEFEKDVYEKLSYSYGFVDENESEAYKLRRFVRRALEGDCDAAESLGLELMEEKNNMKNKVKRLVFHDDYSAIFYLNKAARTAPNSWATYEAISLSSNPESRTFNFEYARNL